MMHGIKRGITTVLFDLDGTLLDTAADMGGSLNTLREEHNEPPLDAEIIRPWVSHGSPGLLKLAFEIEPGHANYPALRERFLDLYMARIAEHTRLFAGMADVLEHIETNSMRWGIVTNKPGWLTEPLLEAVNLTHRAACVISGDTTARRKPHPDPLLRAFDEVPCRAEETIYVGDAERDIAAGRAAGCAFTIAAAYGYIPADEDVATWQADTVIHTPAELLGILQETSATSQETG